MTNSHDYDPWIAGRMLIKFDVYQRWPTAEEAEKWLEGFKYGAADMAEFEHWPQRLWEYTNGKNAPSYITKFARKPLFPLDI